MGGNIGNSGDGSETNEDGGGEGDEERVEESARGSGFSLGLAAIHAGFHEVGREAVPIGFAERGGAPLSTLFRRGARKRDGGHAENHEQRTADDLRISGGATAVQFTENEHAPEQAPELIGIRKGNAAAYADVFGGVLLEEIADDPDESAEHEPEDDAARGRELREKSLRTKCAERERRHHAEFADGEERDEAKRVHTREIGFAVGDVHGAPENAGPEGGENAVHGIGSGGVRAGGSDGQNGSADAHDE